MLKRTTYLLIALFSMGFMFQSCTSELEDIQNEETSIEIISFDEIKTKVENALRKGTTFNWEDHDANMTFSAAMHSDSFISVGYTISPDFNIVENIHTINLQDKEWVDSRILIENLILENEKSAYTDPINIRDIQPFGTVSDVPQIIVKVNNLETVERLRDHPSVRFVEPLGFNISDVVSLERSNSGCSGNPNYSINSADYTTLTPGIKYPWNFGYHNIEEAWGSSNKGDNTKVCIIDSGASFSQDNLGSNFNSGDSYGRSVEKYSTKYSGSWWWKTLDSPDDPCGHGTSMAGNAAAPRSNDGNSVGVAYQSNLMSIRAVEDVIISTSNERNGVRDALILAGNSSSVKVISMSIGSPFYSSTVADGVYYAYNNQKLMFGAAGTSLSWTSWYPVIFPANMSQVRAVTGVKNTTSLKKCTVCHQGPEVDFVIVMERSNDDDRVSLGLARYSNQPKYVGGSSTATATTAGIATMVWAENPSASRTAIINALKNASSEYPGRHSNLGWGKIDALQAVNGL